MDEYTILKKKRKKNGFASTALLISIAIALIAMVGAVLILGKVDNQKVMTTDENSTVDELKATSEVTTSNKDATCEGLVKEIVFNDNLKTIKEAAISYFTNERLPQTKGDTVKITLKEMKDKKLLLNVRDASGNTCSENNSYVEVTKEDNEYLMKIFLSCSDLEDYIIVHLGCYDYCDSNVCEKKEEPVKEYEYEYKKVTGCKMSDWSAWGEWKKTREKTSNLKKEDTKVETTTKEVDKVVDATVKVTYNCDKYPGYTLVDNKCVKETSVTSEIPATESGYSYSCADYPGYTLVGKKCVKETTKKVEIPATKVPTTYSCQSGFTLSGTKCYRTVTKTSTKNVIRSCDSGYTLNGTKCTKTISTTDTKPAEAVYSTREVKNYFTCYKENCTTKTVFQCPTGKACGNYPVTSCTKVKKTCWEPGTEKYISGYNCPSNYTLGTDKSGNKICTKTTTTTDTKDSKVSCPSGYTLNGNSCVKTYEEKEEINATPSEDKYTCPSDYALFGTKCIKYVTVRDEKDATRISGGYTCPDEYTLNGKVCKKVTKVTDKKDASGKVTYTCPSGYTKKDNKCAYKGTETIKTTYYRYATRSCNGGSTDYKWSTSKNDSILLSEGYKLTGKKRELIVK